MRLVSSDCASSCSASMMFAVMISVVSSAYVYTFEIGTVLMISLMFQRKSVVDSVLPCGIPCVMVLNVDFACCVCVCCVRL